MDLSRPAHLAATLLSLAAAAHGYGFGGFGSPFGSVGPYDANSPEWLEAVAASNSTGLFRFSGPDVSKVYPGPATPVAGWTISVAAVDVPTADQEQVTTIIDGVPQSNRLVGYSMTIQAPDSLLKTAPDGTKVVDADPSWGMCAWYGESPPFSNRSTLWNNPQNKPIPQDGSCAGYLSDACIAAVLKAASTSWYLNDKPNQWGSHVVCGDLDGLDDACGPHGPGNVGLPLSSYTGIPLAYLNGSVTNTDGWDFSTDNYTAEDVRNMWDSMVMNVWPTVLLFVNATNGTAQDGWETKGLAQLQCVAPDGTGTGKAFTWSGSSNGSGQGGQPGGNGGTGQNGTGGGGGKNGAGPRALDWATWGTFVPLALLYAFFI